MKSLFAGAAIVAFLMAIQLVAAGVMLGAGKIMLLVLPDANEMWWPGILVGLLGVAAGIGFGFGLMRVISRQLGRGRARGRG